jgi:RNA-binding protein NOB1
VSSDNADNAEGDNDDDTRSVITNITNATITPSESASTVSRNAYHPLKPPSSSGSDGTRSDGVSHKISAFENESIITNSQISNTSTAKATVETPSLITSDSNVGESVATQPLASPRHVVVRDWSAVYDNEENDGSHLTEESVNISLDGIALSDSDDGEGFWITPSNIKKHKIRDSTTTNSIVSASSGAESKPTRRRNETAERGGPVMKSACMTGDYAMQNVALQMGLNLVSMEGGGVRQVKTWVLRCHGCFTYRLFPPVSNRSITKKMDLKFCPACGGNTLLRTSTSTSAKGEVRIHLKKNMQWTNRGTKVLYARCQVNISLHYRSHMA